MTNIITADPMVLKPVKQIDTDYELVDLTEEYVNRGRKNKKLKAVQMYGYEVGRGLTKKIINPDDVYKLAAIGSTHAEIARWFDIDENTLTYNFREAIDKGKEELKQSLRQAQLKLALSGNAVMLIWLGKNILGQSDNPVDSTANRPLPWTDE